jgi:hypothetical protein
MLTVAPRGSTKLVTPRRFPAFSEQSMLRGRVADEEAVENAVATAGAI